MANDLDVAPQDSRGVARAERLHCGFLRGESAGEVDRGHAAPRAVGNLAVRKNPPQETIAMPLDGVGNAADIGGVETKADDVWHDVVNGD